MLATLSELDNHFQIDLEKSINEIHGGKVYLSSFNPSYSNDGKKVVIEIGKDSLAQYQKLIRVLEEKLGFKVGVDKTVQNTLYIAEQERQKFSEFSEKARTIRNDQCDTREFEEFKNSLSNFRIKLKIFQLLAAYHLSFSQNSCNFSVPGAGKTITVYGAYNYLKQLPKENIKKVDVIVVVGPLSSFKAWKDDYNKVYGRKPKYLEIYGGISKKTVSEKLNSTLTGIELVLINYHSLNTYLEELINYMKLNKTMLVLDEAHKIKKIDDGLWSTSALGLAKFPVSRVVLTGTPAPNGYEDIYNLYKFIWPSRDVIGYSPGQLSTMSKNNNDYRLNDLQNRIEPFFIRITKNQLKLPDAKFIDPILVEMGKIQQAIYDELNNKTPSLERDAKNNPSIFQSRLIRLRQAATNPNLLNRSLKDYYDYLDGDFVHQVKLVDDLGLTQETEEMVKNYLKNETPSKFLKTLEITQQLIAENEKIIIWCEFVGNILDLSRFLTKNAIKNELLYGGVDNEKRESIIDQFHTDDELKVIIANPHAVGESISLHFACHNAIYLEQSFNAASYMQSKDRIHRLGLTPDVVTRYFYLHSLGTVDEVIHKRVLEKEEKMIGIIESREIPLFTNNADFLEDNNSDLKAIIRHYYETANRLV